MLNVDYPVLLKLFSEHLDPKRRTESAAFLIWYLEHYYRLDKTEAIDAVCDQKGDKGVDGIFVNDSNQTITIFQSKISQKTTTTIGDASLREFAGTLRQFKDADSVNALAMSASNTQLARLLKLHDIASKIESYDVMGEFVTNVDMDQNGKNFLRSQPHITFVGRINLVSEFISTDREPAKVGSAKFDVFGLGVAEYLVNAKIKSIVAPVRASELAQMKGIADQSLFAYNVRGPLGRTGVNKDIASSMKNKSLHKLFPLFHNGITVICRKVDVSEKTISITDYHVVNGCQSISAIFHNQDEISADLRILAKFIQMDPASDEARMITTFSNNQNGIRARDSKSNAPAQVRLQNEFSKLYKNEYAFRVKRGETFNDNALIIENEDAGLWLLAFDLQQPWATHRKYEVFEDRHAELFGRPEVTADKIVMCHTIMMEIENDMSDLENKAAGKYVLTKFMMLYAVKRIFEKDSLARDLMERPGQFVRQPSDRKVFRECVSTVIKDLVTDLNSEISGVGDDFDYRGALRDQDWVKKTTSALVDTHAKLVRRKTIKPFGVEWTAAMGVKRK